MARKQCRAWMAAVLSLFLVLTASSVTAKTSDIEHVLFDLDSLGIVKQEGLQLDQAVTRGAFSTLIVRLMNLETVAQSLLPGASPFADITGSANEKAIYLLSNMRVVNGVSEDRFDPDGIITVQQASKILVSVLGYYEKAAAYGGYPAGYTQVARQIGLYAGVDDTAEELSMEAACRMLCSALDADRMVAQALGGDVSYAVEPGNTLRSCFASKTSGGMTKKTGIVTATVDMYLISADAAMTADEIEIDGTRYTTSMPSARQYIGQQVDYYLYNDNGREILVNIMPSDKNRVTELDGKDLSEVRNGRVEYYPDEGGKASALTLADGVMILYNCEPQYSWTAAELMNHGDAAFKFIDNNGDNRVEVVLLEEHESAVVDAVRETGSTILLREPFEIGGSHALELEPSGSDAVVYVYGRDGKELEPKEIQSGDVVSVIRSGDGNHITVWVSGEKASGCVEQIFEDYAVIGGEKYEFEDMSQKESLKLGSDITAYLSVYGKIVWTQQQLTDQYCYVLDASDTGSLSRTLEVRVLKPALLSEKQEEVENEEGGENTSRALLSCRNDSVGTYTLASNVRLEIRDKDGVTLLRIADSRIAENLTGRLYEYKTNSRGEIVSLIEPEIVGAMASRRYNSYERTFGKTNAEPFGVDENTLTICVPAAGSSGNSDDDLLTRVEMNNDQLYDIAAYELDDHTHTAKLAVIVSPMQAGSPGLINSKSKIGFVNNAMTTLNENGETVYAFTIVTEGAEKEFTASPLVTTNEEGRTDFAAIRSGDVIAYSVDGEDRLDAYTLFGNLAKQPMPDLTGEVTEKEVFTGYILDMEYNVVSKSLNRWVHRLEVGLEKGGAFAKRYEIQKTNSPAIYIYDRKRETAVPAAAEELDPGMEILVAASNGVVRGVVGVR